jgi:catechol 2,3-dioxygenase-like lactoylglutathione lyase family enzyme
MSRTAAAAMATGEARDGIEINGVAHVILRVNRIAECIAFYDQVMPFLGLKAVPPRSDSFVYYVGGRTAVAIREADSEQTDVVHVETAPGLDHICFRARSREDVDRVFEFLGEIGADIVRPPEEGPWAPGYYSLSVRDPEGIRLELNHVPGPGLLAEGAAFDPAPDHPIEGRPRARG